MSRTKTIVFATTIAGFGVICGFKFSQYLQSSATIVNKSGHMVSHVHVQCNSFTFEQDILQNGEQIIIPLHSQSESSMAFTFVGLNGHEGKGGDGYFSGKANFIIEPDDKVINQ